MVYNIFRVENDGVYIALFRVDACTRTEHVFVYYSNHTMFGGDVEEIYCEILVGNGEYAPIRFI